MYTKDIISLLRLLQTSKQSGKLFVEPPKQNESSWQGQFRLEKGVLKSCLVYNKTDGRVLISNEEAVRWLTSQGRLDWRLEEDTQILDSLSPSLLQGAEAKKSQRHDEEILPSSVWKTQLGGIPQRTQQGINAPVDSFISRDHRQIFALVDGRRTIGEIIKLLHKPPYFVIRIIQELHASGLIV